MSKVQGEDIPSKTFDTLCDVFQQDPTKKYHSFVLTQSLRKLMQHVDPNDVIEMLATGQELDQQQSFEDKSPPGKAASSIMAYERFATGGELRYRKSKHGQFPWEDIQTWLDLETTVDDLAIRELVVMVRDEQLQRHARDVLQEAFGLNDLQYLQSPFFFRMKSRKAEDPTLKRRMKDTNDKSFLKSKGYNVLENKSMYSLRAQQKRGDVPMGISPRDLEDLAFNFSEKSDQSYGVLYSMLFINRWQTVFGNSMTETSRSTWDEQGEWSP